MNPLFSKELVELRHEELRREARARRLAGDLVSGWEHPWRRGLGQQLEHWGQRLRGGVPADGSLSRSSSV